MQDEEPKWEQPGKNNSGAIKITNPLILLDKNKYKKIIDDSRADSYSAVIEELKKINKSDSVERKDRIKVMIQEAVDIAHFKGNNREVIKLRKKAQKKDIHIKNPAK